MKVIDAVRNAKSTSEYPITGDLMPTTEVALTNMVKFVFQGQESDKIGAALVPMRARPRSHIPSPSPEVGATVLQ